MKKMVRKWVEYTPEEIEAAQKLLNSTQKDVLELTENIEHKEIDEEKYDEDMQDLHDWLTEEVFPFYI